jgi:hypothetical protein
MKVFFLCLIFLLFTRAQAQLHVDLREVKGEMRAVFPLLQQQWKGETARIRLSQWKKTKDGEVHFKGHTHLVSVEKGGVFQLFQGVLKNQQLVDFQIQKIIPISQIHFVVRAYIKALVTEVEAPEHQIRILYPFGGPGIDHGVTPRAEKSSVFMTPFFSGYLMRDRTITKRCEPAHYKCKPFIRLIPEGSDHSLYGYHAEPFKDQFERGFVSAGCFRLQDSDLWEMLTIVKFGALAKIPIEMIEDDLSLRQAHPFPKVEDSYEGITRWRLKDGRIVFNSKRISAPPPLDSVRFQTLKEVKRIDTETRARFLRPNSDFYTKPRE